MRATAQRRSRPGGRPGRPERADADIRRPIESAATVKRSERIFEQAVSRAVCSTRDGRACAPRIDSHTEGSPFVRLSASTITRRALETRLRHVGLSRRQSLRINNVGSKPQLGRDGHAGCRDPDFSLRRPTGRACGVVVGSAPTPSPRPRPCPTLHAECRSGCTCRGCRTCANSSGRHQ
jgi:hypothetical protein